MDIARVVELYSPGEGAGGQVGSGYLIGSEVVLTAAHVVVGLPLWPVDETVPTEVAAPGVCSARPLGERDWVPAVVAWRDEVKDLAVLRLAFGVPPLPTAGAEPRWGQVVGSEPVDVSAVGFPWAQERPDRVRDSEQLVGFVAPAAMAKAHLYAVTVTSATPSARAGGSPWAGMSGAALFAGPFLVGVVVVDPDHFGPDRVAAAPVAPLLSDPDLAGLLDTSADRVVAVRGPSPWEGQRGTDRPPVDTVLLPPAMVGRACELTLLRAAAREAITGGSPVSIVVVHGMGGAGKTAVARQLATEVAGSFPDTRIEVDLYGFTPDRQPRDPGAVLDELLRVAGYPATEIPATTEGRSQLWRSYLSPRRSLLVLDNARDAEQLRPLLPGGAGSGRCLVVVTSRDRLAELETSAVVEVGTLPPADAIALLIHASHMDATQVSCASAELEALAALCGYLPLALRAVGSLLARLSPADLVDVMRSASYPLQELGDADQAAGRAFAVSYQALAPPLQDALRACAWHPGPNFDADSIAALIDEPRGRAIMQLPSLADSNVLMALPRQRYGIHDVFLVYARREADSRDGPFKVQAGNQRLCARLFCRLDAAASLIHTDNRRVIGRDHDNAGFTGRDQARIWLTAAADELSTVAHAALRDNLADSAPFAETLAYWLHADGKTDQPRLLYDALHKAAGLSGDRAGQAAALAGRGLMSYVRGEYPAAEVALRESCGLYRQIGDRLGEANVVKSLADIHRVRGDDSGADDGYRHAYDLYAAIGDARGQADALNGVGDMAYARRQQPEAQDSYQRAHDLCEQIGYRSGQADALCGLGGVALLGGRSYQARDVFARARDIYVDIGNVHGLAYAMKGLGDAARQGGDTQQATVSYREALDLYERIGFRNCYADVLIGLGRVAQTEGDEERADSLYTQAYDISHQIGYRDGETVALDALDDRAQTGP
ncbi:MAG: tetratricopeptide repeat protein [Actinomycetota bacterium]|nr:tetratricopeptide repeat protein [Actinomycetota bacterium]